MGHSEGRAWIAGGLGLAFFVGLGCGGNSPKAVPAEEAARLVRSLSQSVSFGRPGLAWFRGRLYATTNVGLFEVDEDHTPTLFRWRADDAVVEGPWADPARDALWLWDLAGRRMQRLDARGWTSVPLPRLKDGYSRGDILAGFRATSDDSGFRLIAAGQLWRWDPREDSWAAEALPFEHLVAFARLRGTEVALVQDRLRAQASGKGRIHARVLRDGGWRELAGPEREIRIEAFATSSDAIFVRGADGELLKVDAEQAAWVETPGPCEALAAAPDGRLLAGFAGHGIHEWTGEWTHLAPFPSEARGGKRGVHLAADGDRIAFATDPVLDGKDEKGRWTYSGTTALWILKAGAWRRIRLPGESTP